MASGSLASNLGEPRLRGLLLFDLTGSLSEDISQFRDGSAEMLREISTTVTWSAESSYVQTLREINALTKLEKGWDSYDADVPSKTAFNVARRLVTILKESFLALPHIMPSVEGGITTAYSVNDRFGQIEILNSGTVFTTTFSADNPPEVGQFESDDRDLRNAVETIRNFLFGFHLADMVSKKTSEDR